jgi:hypothetical protein
MRTNVIEDPRARIRRHPNPDQCWLLCDECRRFFQYKSALPSGSYPHDACPFPDCHGYGIGHLIFFWDDLREPEDPRWPSSEEELHHGMRAPEMEEFYQAQLHSRIARLLEGFAGSQERATLAAAPRYLQPFLQMTSDLCCDLTDEDDAWFDPESARMLIDQLPVWSQSADVAEAPRMLDELRAFFAYAQRAAAIADAEKWLALLDDDVIEVLRDTMRTDPRLKRLRQPTRSHAVQRHGARKRKKRTRRHGSRASSDG